MKILTVDRRAARWARDLVAVRAAICAWAIVGALPAIYLLLPGADRDHSHALLACTGVALLWSGLLAALPAKRWLIPLFQFGTVLGVAAMPLMIAASGGSTSPLRALPLVVIVYCTVFYETRMALCALAVVLVLHVIPFAYDEHAFRAAGLETTVVLGVIYVLTAVAMIVARRELVEMRDAARAEALHDPLTDIANRRALMAFLDKRAGGRRAGDRLGLVLIDLDGFKQVNTAHGHGGGDLALTAAARALRATARDTDLVARLGGDEFAIVAPNVDPDALRALAERAVFAVRNATGGLDLPGVRLGASAGVALLPDDAAGTDDLLAAADSGLRAAKRAGKGCVLSAGAAAVVGA